MNRRTFLAVATGAATAGCAGKASPLGGDDRTESRTVDDPPNDDPSFPGTACPSFAGDVDRTVCYSRRGSSDVYLEPSTQRFVEYEGDNTVETMTFTLRNESDVRFSTSPDDWTIYRWNGEEWTDVGSGGHPKPLYRILPGRTYEWVLSTTQHPSPRSEASTDVVVDLASGETYAFRVDGSLGDRRIECVARFEYVRAVPEG